MDENLAGIVVETIVLAACCGILLAAVMWAVSLVQMLWAWVDDREKVGNNLLVDFLMIKVLGWKPSDGSWKYEKGSSRSDGDVAIARWVMTGVAIPPFLVFLHHQFWVAVSLPTLVLVLFLARFARRTNKVLKKHMADPQAHK